MDDIFAQVREGNALNVRLWLDNTENDLNQGDDHRFSLLHWASLEGHANIVDMLIQRGARINATNMGDDTALHLAVSRNHRDIAMLLMANKANVNATNEHGNSPLHYACFWNFGLLAEDLIKSGALVSLANRRGNTPLDKCKRPLADALKAVAVGCGQNVERVEAFEDRSLLGYKTRSRDATLSRHLGIDMKSLKLQSRLSNNHSGDIWKGTWQESDIVAKILNIKQCTMRMARDFQEEFPRLRIFNHPNILPVLGASSQLPNLVLISQWMPNGSLFNIIHGGTDVVVDQSAALRFAADAARGMEFLHSMEPMIPNFFLTSKHIMIDKDIAKVSSADDMPTVMVDEDMTARINMADYKFTFHEKNKQYSPAWVAPEALLKKPSEINLRAADMWSYAILLWELATREVPFGHMVPAEVGMKIALEGLRVTIPPGTSPHMSKLISICMNEDAGKRPRFDMILPILEKMKITN